MKNVLSKRLCSFSRRFLGKTYEPDHLSPHTSHRSETATGGRSGKGRATKKAIAAERARKIGGERGGTGQSQTPLPRQAAPAAGNDGPRNDEPEVAADEGIH